MQIIVRGGTSVSGNVISILRIVRHPGFSWMVEEGDWMRFEGSPSHPSDKDKDVAWHPGFRPGKGGQPRARSSR
jgi:hypothetical protein